MSEFALGFPFPALMGFCLSLVLLCVCVCPAAFTDPITSRSTQYLVSEEVSQTHFQFVL